MKLSINDKKLIDIISRMNRTNDALNVIGIETMKFVKKTFVTEGEELLGSKWRPLSNKTIEMRRKGKGKSQGLQILTDTGVAKRSISYEINGNSVYIGFPPNTARYMFKHQFGLKVPKRQILGYNEKLQSNINHSLQALVQEILK